jgi:hypothetical protein
MNGTPEEQARNAALQRRQFERHRQIKENWTAMGYDVPKQIENLAAEGLSVHEGLGERTKLPRTGGNRFTTRRGPLRPGFNPGFNAPRFSALWANKEEDEPWPGRVHLLDLHADHPDPRSRMWMGGTREHAKPPGEPAGVPARFRVRYLGPASEDPFPEISNAIDTETGQPLSMEEHSQKNLIDTEDPDEASRVMVAAMMRINRIAGRPKPRRAD